MAVQLVTGGMILAAGGGTLFRALLFHWFFLGFLWPFFFLENTVAYPLRVLLTDISVKFLNLVGLPTIQSGTSLLSAPDAAAGLATGERFRMDIEGPCSGLRSLFAMMMVGAVFARMTQRRFLPGLVVFLSALPMAVLGNFVRLLLLVAGTLLWGTEFAIGPVNEKGEPETSAYHFFAGIAVFLVGLMGLSVVAALVRGKGRRRSGTSVRTIQNKGREAGQPPLSS
jgi:exosortase/archaeosortase family protein